MKNLIFIFCILLSSWQIKAQENTISGTVTTDVDGLPLPGASVIIKGTQMVLKPILKVNMQLKPNQGDVLIFSVIRL